MSNEASGQWRARRDGIAGISESVEFRTTTSRVFCGQLEVQPELLFEVSVAPPSKQGSPETVTPFGKNAHAISLPSRLAVQQPERIQRLKDHQVECALQNAGS